MASAPMRDRLVEHQRDRLRRNGYRGVGGRIGEQQRRVRRRRSRRPPRSRTASATTMPSSPAARRRPVVISRRRGDPAGAEVCVRTAARRRTGCAVDEDAGGEQHARLGGEPPALVGAQVDLGHRQRILVAKAGEDSLGEFAQPRTRFG